MFGKLRTKPCKLKDIKVPSKFIFRCDCFLKWSVLRMTVARKSLIQDSMHCVEPKELIGTHLKELILDLNSSLNISQKPTAGNIEKVGNIPSKKAKCCIYTCAIIVNDIWQKLIG